MFTDILLAVDGSAASLEAARQGIALAKVLKA
jgi:nucleotide-binding universal stress UspA family protein